MTSTAQTNEELRAENERLRKRLSEAEAALRRASLDALRPCDERLRLALELTGTGVFDFDPQTGQQSWSAQCREIWGLPPDAEVTPEVVLNTVHPDDRERVKVLTEGALDPHGPGAYCADHRIIRPDGSERWLRVRGRTLFGGPDGVRRGLRSIGTMLDVTELKRAEEALRQAQDRVETVRKQSAQALRDSQKQNEFLAGLIRDASQPVAIGYADGRLGLVNRAFEQLTGYTAEELRSLGWVALTPPEWHQMEWDQLAEQRRTGRPVRYEKEYRRKDGTRVPIELLVHLVPDSNGDPEYYYSFVTDITPRKRTESALRASEERMRLATEATGVGIWEWNVITNELRWDPQMFRIYGIPPTPDGLVTYAVWRDAVVPEDLPRQEELLRETIDRIGQGVREFRIQRNERAEVRYIRSVETVRTDDRGRAEWVVGTNLDITERKDAEAALREAERRWRTLAEALPNLVWTCPPDGRCDWLSSQWGKYTGIPENELLGLRWLEVVHPDDRAPTSACWSAACADRGNYDLEYRIRRSDGVYRWFKTRGVPIRDERGRIVYWFGTCTDIQDRKRIEQELRDADRRKDEFLATLAHELRNPLAPIRNGLEMLRLSGGQAPTFERVRTMMDRQLTQMVRLVDDLLDVSRISRGKIDLRRERVRLAAVIDSAVETSRPLIEQMGHELTVALPPRPVVVDADLTRLAQVFLNLLNNAAKYTERGGHIWLTAEQRGREVAVSVRDTGIGIPTDQLPRIFEMFSQVDRSLERAQGGLGIGLTLVKQLVEMHGGRVEARSAGPGQGSEFIVRLPAVEGSTTAPRAPGDHGPARECGLRVLIVDDNRDSADSLAALLEAMGHDTRTVYDGAAAVAAAVEFRPDVILLDLGLPALTGYEVCARIREHPFGQDTVIIAQTGRATDADRARTRDAGFDHHMVKPVDPAALMELLAGVAPAPRK